MEEEEDEKGGGSPSFAATVGGGNGGVVPGHLPFWRRSDIPRGHASTRRRRRGLLGPGPPLPPPPPLVSVLIVGLSYGARTVLSYTRRMMLNFLAFRDSHIIPLRRSPTLPQVG